MKSMALLLVAATALAEPPNKSQHPQVGLLAEIPDLAAFEAFMKTDAAAEAIRHDGVRLETMVMLAES